MWQANPWIVAAAAYSSRWNQSHWQESNVLEEHSPGGPQHEAQLAGSTHSVQLTFPVTATGGREPYFGAIRRPSQSLFSSPFRRERAFVPLQIHDHHATSVIS